MIALRQLNDLPEERFAAALDGVFEHSPWVARRAAALRPFTSRLHLLEAMRAVVLDASDEEQLALIRAHPELAGKAAIRNELTAASTQEQRSAGLSDCTPEEFARLSKLNDSYGARFGFPFILAVRGHDRTSIITEFEKRLENDAARERQVALLEIGRIAAYRLIDRVASPAGPEILAMADSLARHSEHDTGLTCSYLTPTHRAVALQIKEWMLAAGLIVSVDAVGNVVGRLESDIPGAKTLMTGSHYDTVVNGGRYDGRLGVLLPIAVAMELRQDQVHLPFNLEIVAFSDEEGVRFKTTFIGSSAVSGSFDPAVLDIRDSDGITMRDAIVAAGGDPALIPLIARQPHALLGYVEVHIEQGPLLLESGQALGVVTSIAGSVRYEVSITGLAGHAGTVPMHMRRDAAAAAAEIVLAIERRCSAAAGLVGTVGKLTVPNGAVNVIPGRCELTLDLRAGDDATRDTALADVLAQIESIAARRKVEVGLRRLMEASATPCSARLQSLLAASIERITGEGRCLFLPSGAGHDAMKMADIAEVGMLFVRCGAGGISHHPAETVDTADADIAARVFADFLMHYKQDP